MDNTTNVDKLLEEVATSLHTSKGYVIDQARLAGIIFKTHSKVQDVYLFGSVARDGLGKDIDMVLTVDTVTYNRYMERMKWCTRLREGSTVDDRRVLDTAYFLPNARFYASLIALRNRGVWQLNFSDLLFAVCRALGCSLIDDRPFDLFLFPIDWKDRLDELQNALPHRDPGFMHNIAEDAIKIA